MDEISPCTQYNRMFVRLKSNEAGYYPLQTVKVKKTSKFDRLKNYRHSKTSPCLLLLPTQMSQDPRDNFQVFAISANILQKLRNLGRSRCEYRDNDSSSGKKNHPSRNIPLNNSLALEIPDSFHQCIYSINFSLMHWIHIFMNILQTGMAELLPLASEGWGR